MESWILDLGLQRSIANTRIAILPQYSLSFALERNKPYFGRQLSAFQSPPVRYALIAALTKYALAGKTNVRVLEIGSWAGASAITFGTVIQELGVSSGEIVCVDLWENYFGEEDISLHYKSMSAGAVTGSIQDLFRHNIRACGLEGMIQVKKAISRDALPELDDESCDLVYIDGSHKIDEVLYDIQEAKRLVKSGGLICGDDLELRKSQVDQDAHRAALEKGGDFITDPQTGASYHPGVTEAISALFNDLWHEHGLWCVKRSGETWCAPAFQAQSLDIPRHLQHTVEIPYGVFRGYEIFQLGDGFVAYPNDDLHWFQNRILESSLEELVLLLDTIQQLSRILPETTRTELVVEGYCGFNILRHNGRWCGFDQSVGSIDIGSLGQSVLENMKRDGNYVAGESVGDVKSEILRLLIAQAGRRDRVLQEELDTLRQQVERVSGNLLVKIKLLAGRLFNRNKFKP